MLKDLENQILIQAKNLQKQGKQSFSEISGLLDNVHQLFRLSVLDQKLQPYWGLCRSMIGSMNDLEKMKNDGCYFIEIFDHVIPVSLKESDNITKYQDKFYDALSGIQNMFIHLHKNIDLIPLPDKDTGTLVYTGKARIAVQRKDHVCCCYLDAKNQKASQMGIVEDTMQDAIISLQDTNEWCNILYTGKTFNAPMKESVIPVLINKYNKELYKGKFK